MIGNAVCARSAALQEADSLPSGCARLACARRRGSARPRPGRRARALGILFERGQLLVPVRLDLVELVSRGPESPEVHLVDPHTGIVLDAFLADEPGLAKDAQMPGQRGRAHFDAARELARAERLAQQLAYHRSPRGIGKRKESSIERRRGPRAHFSAGLRRRCVIHQTCPSGSIAQ